MQAVEDLEQRQGAHPRGRQLDRQRHPIKALTDLRDDGRTVIGHGEAGLSETCAVGEQLNRLVSNRQRRHPPRRFTGHPDRLTTRCQHGQPRRPTQQGDDQLGAGIEQVLAVVQHHQRLTVTDETQQRVHGGASRLVGQSQRAGHRDRHHVGVGDRRQIHIPNPVAEFAGKLARDLDGQAGFTGSARAGQGH